MDADPKSPIQEGRSSAFHAASCSALVARRESQRKRTARYRKTEKFNATLSKWKDSTGREYQKKWMAEKRAAQSKTTRPLTDAYVRDTLASRSPLHRSEIPLDLVEAQRNHLQLKRELRKEK